jgi:hypothetical protein
MTSTNGMAWAGLQRELELVLSVFEEDQMLILQRRGTGRYVQLYVSGPGDLHIEASSNRFLQPKDALDDGQVAALLERGWKAPATKGAPNFSADLKGPRATEEAARLTVQTLAEILGAGAPADLEYDAFEKRGGRITLPPLKLEQMRREVWGG